MNGFVRHNSYSPLLRLCSAHTHTHSRRAHTDTMRNMDLFFVRSSLQYNALVSFSTYLTNTYTHIHNKEIPFTILSQQSLPFRLSHSRFHLCQIHSLFDFLEIYAKKFLPQFFRSIPLSLSLSFSPKLRLTVVSPRNCEYSVCNFFVIYFRATFVRCACEMRNGII